MKRAGENEREERDRKTLCGWFRRMSRLLEAVRELAREKESP